MPIQKITIADFLQLAKQHPVVDVRSPGEYAHAHIPGAVSLPLFSDEERKIVGTAYKQQGKQAAIKLGLDFFGVKMKQIVEEAEAIFNLKSGKESTATDTAVAQLPVASCLLLHCWRGGMRSAGMAWLLDLYGFTIYTLIGGYKAYRRWALAQFEKPYPFKIISGYTGSGKTLLLKELQKNEQPVIDLEELAVHKGSAFGALGQSRQPRQEMFENLLAGRLAEVSYKLPGSKEYTPIFIEDESQRIGNVIIPQPLWNVMRQSQVHFIDVPFEERLDYIVDEYGKFNKEELGASIIRIQKRLGGQETKNAIQYLEENNVKECFKILLAYYDRSYTKGLQNRENITALLTTIHSGTIDAKINVLHFIQPHE